MNWRGHTEQVEGVIDINLLPARHRPQEISGAGVAIGAFVIVAMIALVPLAFRLSSARANADAEMDRARIAEQSLRDVQIDLAAHRGLEAELQDTQSQLDALESQREDMQGGTRPLADDLVIVFNPAFTPPGARVTGVSGTKTGLRIEGTAAGPLDAIAFAQRLSGDGAFASSQMVSYAPGAAGGQFAIEVER